MTTAETAASPSLRKGEGGPAFEIKFPLTESAAGEVEAWARGHLIPDPHGEAALGGAYRTVSLYCDTPELDVYHGSPAYRRRKFRVRQYGDTPAAFLERKSKRGDRVAKRRVTVPFEELALLADAETPADWAGHWFHRRLTLRRLVPACRVAYERTAFFGECAEGPLRLTLDRGVRGVPAHEWSLGPVEGGQLLLPGRVILELKFRSALPMPFKELMTGLGLNPGPVSKYRLCREAWGAPPPGRGAEDA